MGNEEMLSGTAGAQDEEIRPCLIGGFPRVNAIEPKRFGAVSLENGSVCSLDMVRIELRFASKYAASLLNEEAETLPNDDYSSYTVRLKPGAYRTLHTFYFEEADTSAALGVGLIECNCRVNMFKGFLEFNPNKLGDDPAFCRLFDRLAVFASKADVMRYDLACDVPVYRGAVRVEKDRRKYRLDLGSAMTEYLGCRNTPGYVKVYDKAAEAGLAAPDGCLVPLTRIELTCDGAWSVGQVAERWPRCYALDMSSIAGSRGWLKALCVALADEVARGESVEQVLSELDSRTRTKVRGVLECRPVVEFPEAGSVSVLVQASSWADRLVGRCGFEIVDEVVDEAGA